MRPGDLVRSRFDGMLGTVIKTNREYERCDFAKVLFLAVSQEVWYDYESLDLVKKKKKNPWSGWA